MQVKVHYISLVKSYTNKSQDEFTFPNRQSYSRSYSTKSPRTTANNSHRKSMTQPRKR